MKKLVKITALKDRQTLNIKAGEVLEMELEGDALVMLYHEQTLGLVKVEEIER